jgi:hypothetical protein
MDCDARTASVNVKHIENCEIGNNEGHIVYLSPEFPISLEDAHRDLAFPSIEHTCRLLQAQDLMGINRPSFQSYEEAREHVLNSPEISDIWPILKKGWSLSLKGQDNLAKKKLEGYKRPEYRERFELNYVLFDFCGQMLMPGKYHLFEEAAELTENIAKNQTVEYRKFQKYYIENMYENNMNRYFEMFSEFFKCYTDFSQTLTFMQHDLPLDSKYQVSSTSFGKTKLFYGNAFEAFTSNIAVLACLNNVLNGRSFDQFESMDLDKYLTINKANRSNPFKGSEPYYNLCECLDSTFRNASHHGAMKLDRMGRRIHYKSGGTGSDRNISYKDYIDMCNSIMLSSCALLSMELAIAF